MWTRLDGEQPKISASRRLVHNLEVDGRLRPTAARGYRNQPAVIEKWLHIADVAVDPKYNIVAIRLVRDFALLALLSH
ncbi:hypothetical protein V9T40_005099 [Parthenolecanium corni]|uniref:Uncharacterized protein n=1 Tax=Parthenolecanium corni TaxID=536013 RepID=A0AAN9TUE6_9HEMI